MRTAFSLLSLLVAAALLLGSNGLHSTLLGVRGALEGFSGAEIALLLTAYYVGFILGCRRAPRVIQQVGHIRAFTAFASIASAAALSHALIVESWFWIPTRIITGFSFAALQMIIESWLNERATNQNRGKILSVYRITDFTSVTAFQAVLPVFDPKSYVLFALLSILISIALVPVALTRVEAPPVPKTAKLNVRGLWRVSPLAAAGAFLIGVAASSYWSMTPLFVSGLGYHPDTAGLFIGAIVFGGALAQWPVGWLSDQIDRRTVIIGTMLSAASVGLVLPSMAAGGEGQLIAAGLVFGAVAVPAFGLVIAHANDSAEPGTSVSVNGGLLLLYGVAATAGPIVASQVMRLFGPEALFTWIALAYLTCGAFGVYRTFRNAAPAPKDDYVPVMRTTPALFELDPRAEAPGDRQEASEGLVEGRAG